MGVMRTMSFISTRVIMFTLLSASLDIHVLLALFLWRCNTARTVSRYDRKFSRDVRNIVAAVEDA
jgi:hypothetical protein